MMRHLSGERRELTLSDSVRRTRGSSPRQVKNRSGPHVESWKAGFPRPRADERVREDGAPHGSLSAGSRSGLLAHAGGTGAPAHKIPLFRSQ